MHHVLFSFKHYNSEITKIDIWVQMSEEVKAIYLEILRFIIKNCGEIVSNSWRYYITYLKVLYEIIDCNYNHSEDYINNVIDNITPREI